MTDYPAIYNAVMDKGGTHAEAAEAVTQAVLAENLPKCDCPNCGSNTKLLSHTPYCEYVLWYLEFSKV